MYNYIYYLLIPCFVFFSGFFEAGRPGVSFEVQGHLIQECTLGSQFEAKPRQCPVYGLWTFLGGIDPK